MHLPQRLPASAAWVDTQGRYLHLRPQREGDAELLGALWNQGLSPAARYNRFLGQSRPLTSVQVTEQAGLACSPPCDSAQGWVIVERAPGGERALAEGRWTPTARRNEGLLALSVMTRCHRQGLARRLLQALLRSGQHAGVLGLSLHVLEANAAAMRLAHQLGFERKAAAPGSPWLRLHYRFQAPPSQAGMPTWARWINTEPLTLRLTQEDFHV